MRLILFYPSLWDFTLRSASTRSAGPSSQLGTRAPTAPGAGSSVFMAGFRSIATLLKTPDGFHLLFAKGNCGLLILKRARRSTRGFWAVLSVTHTPEHGGKHLELFVKKIFLHGAEGSGMTNSMQISKAGNRNSVLMQSKREKSRVLSQTHTRARPPIPPQ